MKRRTTASEISPESAEDSLCRALLALDDLPSMRAFLRDLCTPSELEAMTDRWKVVPYIVDGVPYREIHELTAVSITTIGRVARFLNEGNDGYMQAVKASRTRKKSRAKA